KRFGDQLPATPVQWLSDNGSAYIAEQTGGGVLGKPSERVYTPTKTALAIAYLVRKEWWVKAMNLRLETRSGIIINARRIS
ncbi:hypothetical protein J7E41_27655, partial [Pseudomonas fluorescens]|nr:hypothetical protein [Pseudomonas fluorescens]